MQTARVARTKKALHWTATVLAALALVGSSVFDLSRSPQVMAGLAHLGYPAYVATILGVWKLLGAATILLPGFPRLKEWAYAGIFFDLTGAALSHGLSGDPVGKVVAPLVLLGVVAVSWATKEARDGSVVAMPKRFPQTC